MKAIFKRDFKGYFQIPLGFIFLSAFFLFAAIPFRYLFTAGSNYISGVFSSMSFIFFLLLALLTMNLFSDERRHKTDQAILTAPVSITGIVLGKYLAALSVYTMALLITVVYGIITAFFVTPDWGLFFSGFLGMYLSGAALIAIGLFVSSITESQVISAVITAAVIIMLNMMDSLGDVLSTHKLDGFLDAISFTGRFNAFLKGIVEFSNIIYFVSIIILFIFFTTRVIERRRWA
jgi:ABC-2 type transport system permease protein